MLPEAKAGRSTVAGEDAGHPEAGLVRVELAHILESKHFRSSRQCSDLLRYIVEHSLAGDDSSLKERVIGTQVFHRASTYDTGEDPVVRVRAADVRKRLAQYYQDREHGSVPLHIELQPGSYRSSFRVEQTPEIARPVEVLLKTVPSGPQISNVRRSGWPIFVVATLLALCGASLVWFFLRPPSPQRLFWAPVTKASQPVLIYLGSNVAYRFTPEYMEQYRAAHSITQNGPEFFVDLPPDSSIRAGDLVPTPDTFVTVGDLAATVQTTSLLNGWNKPFVLRSGRDVAFGDLRNRPSVFIGGFNNSWTLEVTSDLPFSFHAGTRIEDRAHPGRQWSMNQDEHSSSTEDYALISRLLQSKTGGPIVTIAGIGQFGTQAAAEFLASPEKMKDLLKSAPRGWENKNMQAVLHIKVVGFAPVAVEVVATSYW